jgi:uncharacterized protein YecE (DUF72 family)
MVTSWAGQVPPGFVFAIKAPQRITHRQRLADSRELVEHFWSMLAPLGAHLGPVLFQLPPHFRLDLPRLRDFLAVLPPAMQPAFEFRHTSWVDDGVHQALADAGAALCVADTDESPADIGPAGGMRFGYLRLRQAGYDAAALTRWADRIRMQTWPNTFVYFKHEDEGAAPRMALELQRL